MYKKVLVPLDGSALAECTLKHVKELSRKGVIGEIFLLQVIESLRSGFWTGPSGANNIEKIEEQWTEHAEEYLSKIQSQLSSEGIKATIEVVGAFKASQAIIEYAKEKNIGLIVMASQGYSGVSVKQMVFGSVALKVLHEARIPVLLIRPENAEC